MTRYEARLLDAYKAYQAAWDAAEITDRVEAEAWEELERTTSASAEAAYKAAAAISTAARKQSDEAHSAMGDAAMDLVEREWVDLRPALRESIRQAAEKQQEAVVAGVPPKPLAEGEVGS